MAKRKRKSVVQKVKKRCLVTPDEFFSHLIHPMSVDTFMSEYFEKKPFVIKRKSENYYADLFSYDQLKDVIKENHLIYGEDVDVTNVVEGERTTVSRPTERALWADVSKYYHNERCSVRLTCPQKFSDSIYQACYMLERKFGMNTGANTYLTPENSQGFTPHYDDVDTFLCQTEGKKIWHLFQNSPLQLVGANVSSPNFTLEEVGEPSHVFELEQGDLLYMPRGTIHMGKTTDKRSLHVTLSFALEHGWYDFLNLGLHCAMDQMFIQKSSFRQVIPLNTMDFLGTQKLDSEAWQAEKKKFKKNFINHAKNLLNFLDFDLSADLFKESLAQKLLPPPKEFQRETTSKKVSKKSVIQTVADKSLHISLHPDVRDDDPYMEIISTIGNSRQMKESPSVSIQIHQCLRLAYKRLASDQPVKVSDLCELMDATWSDLVTQEEFETDLLLGLKHLLEDNAIVVVQN